MGFLDLFIVALMPVLETVMITAIGLFLALDRINLLGPVARHQLNNLVFFVFSPALVATKLADTITPSTMLSLWFMPVNILLTFIIGSLFGWILVKVTRTPQNLQGLAISCCAAGNLGNLLLIIIPAVCNEKNSPFGDSSTCSTNGMAYASLSMAIGAIYIWSYIYNIIRTYGRKSNEDISVCDSKISTKHSDEASEILKSSVEPLLSKEFPTSEDCETQAELPLTEAEDKVPFSTVIMQHLKNFARRINLQMLFAPSTIATIVGLIIGLISPLQKLLIGDTAPLRVVESSASMLGESTVPAMTLIVGANLLRGLKRSGVGVYLVIGVQIVRYVALPLSGILVVKAANHFGMVGSDPLYQFVLLLQYALPSAMSIGTITQLFEVGESECSVIMLWNYALASLFLTLWTTCYMWFVS